MRTTGDPRRFSLYREVDHTGISGTGYVADGVEWADGSVTLKWRGALSSVAHWRDIDDVRAVHGHEGATVVKWID